MAGIVITVLLHPLIVGSAPQLSEAETLGQRPSHGDRTRPVRRCRSVATFLRLRTAAWRADPDFIFIGVRKCGTTSLYAELVAQPWVLPAILKEIHYFENARWFEFEFTAYRGHFTMRRDLVGPVRCVTGESTPGYISSSAAADRIQDRLPNCKLLVIIRDPTARTTRRAVGPGDDTWVDLTQQGECALDAT